MLYSTWNVDASQILFRQELAAVLKDLKRRAARLPNVQMNLAIVRLACCCGLRASEIGGPANHSPRFRSSHPDPESFTNPAPPFSAARRRHFQPPLTVFTCGSTDWSHGLRGNDPHVTKITKNLLERLSKS
jgi:hypothetical protein